MIDREALLNYAREKSSTLFKSEPEEFAASRQELFAKLSKLSFGERKDPFWKYSKIFESTQTIKSAPFVKHLDAVPSGVLYGRAVSLLDTHKEFFEKYLAKNDHLTNSFFATFAAATSNSYAIFITKKYSQKSIELVFKNNVDRLFVIIEEGVEVEIIETHLHRGLSANLIEYMIGKNAKAKLTIKERGDVLIVSRFFTLEGDSKLQIYSEHREGTIIRNEKTIRLIGEFAEATLLGINSLAGKFQSDTRIIIHHEVPHTKSKTAYRYLIGDRSTGVFGGMIIIAKGADKTEADMTTKAILTSDFARMYGEPQLEIYTDDVICTHGASTGMINEEAVFYLQSRGIDKDKAKKELTESFLAEPLSLLT